VNLGGSRKEPIMKSSVIPHKTLTEKTDDENALFELLASAL
jgi:hypothetical protein